jgi:integrase
VQSFPFLHDAQTQDSWHDPVRADIKNLAPHDLRRTCARLCHLATGELEQIQFLLSHASVQTTERYLGCKMCFQSSSARNLRNPDLGPFSFTAALRILQPLRGLERV